MEGSGQIFEGPSMADADALGRHTLQHQRSNWTGHLKALQHKDDRDTPTDPGQRRYVSAISSDTIESCCAMTGSSRSALPLLPCSRSNTPR